MNRPTFLRRSTALLLTLVLMICAALPGFAAYQMPIQTASDTESVYLLIWIPASPSSGRTLTSSATSPASPR